MINIDVAPCPAPATGEPPLGRGDENAEGCVRLAAQNLDKAKIEAECLWQSEAQEGPSDTRLLARLVVQARLSDRP